MLERFWRAQFSKEMTPVIYQNSFKGETYDHGGYVGFYVRDIPPIPMQHPQLKNNYHHQNSVIEFQLQIFPLNFCHNLA